MKRSEIKTGVVYARQSSKYQEPIAVVVLDLARYYRKPGHSETGWYPRHDAKGSAAPNADKRWGGGGYGFLVVTNAPLSRFDPSERPPVTDLLDVSLDEVVPVGPNAEVRPGMHSMVIAAGELLGEWDDVVGRRAAERELEDDLDRIARAESAERVAAQDARVARLRALGMPGEMPPTDEWERGGRGFETDTWSPLTFDTRNTDGIRLTNAQVDALLSLIPDGARLAEVDEWEYAAPEGACRGPIVAGDEDDA